MTTMTSGSFILELMNVYVNEASKVFSVQLQHITRLLKKNAIDSTIEIYILSYLYDDTVTMVASSHIYIVMISYGQMLKG